jgi:hypothetical protein
MSNLMSCYFRFEGKPTEQQRWVENPMELLVYLIDTVKQMPHKISEEYLTNKDRHILMHSPTHAFTLKPGLQQFKNAVINESYSYTWVRDQLVRPAERFVEYLFMDREMMHFFLEKLLAYVPENFKPRFKEIFSQIDGKKNPREFRSFLVDTMEQDRGLQFQRRAVLSSDQIDNVLWACLPLTYAQEIKNRCEKILEGLPGLSKTQHAKLSDILDAIIERWGGSAFATASTLQDICKAALCICLNATSAPYDYHALIREEAQKWGYAMPTPIFFGDTNWVKDHFAFLINPGTASLELWHIDYTGAEGARSNGWMDRCVNLRGASSLSLLNIKLLFNRLTLTRTFLRLVAHLHFL